jgi:hypothetical protein
MHNACYNYTVFAIYGLDSAGLERALCNESSPGCLVGDSNVPQRGMIARRWFPCLSVDGLIESTVLREVLFALCLILV